MKAWSIIWRLIYGAVLVIAFANLVRMSNDIVEIILPLCIGCLILNIPVYIYKKVNETEGSWTQSYIDWTFHPVRTIILGVLLAPIITIVTVVNLIIEIIQIIFNRY